MTRSLKTCCIAFFVVLVAMAMVSITNAQSDHERLVCKLVPFSSEVETTGVLEFDFPPIGNEMKLTVDITGIPRPSGEAVSEVASLIIVEYGMSPVGISTETYNPEGTAPGCPRDAMVPLARRSGDLGLFNVEDGRLSTQRNYGGKNTVASGANGIIGRGCIVLDHASAACGGDDRMNIVAYGTIGIAQDSAPLKDAPVVENDEIFYAHLTGTENCEDCSGDVFVAGPSTQTTIVGAFKGLSGPKHGFHVHQFGDIRSTTGLSAGGHLNKNGGTHGLPGVNDDRHTGDLGQIQTFDAGDVGYYSMRFDASVDDVGVPMADIVGTTFVVHAGVDHGRGAGCDQAGNAGLRLMYGVIGRVEPEFISKISDTVPSGVVVDNDFETEDCVAPPQASPTGDVPASSTDTPGSPASQLTVSIAMILALVVSLVALLL